MIELVHAAAQLQEFCEARGWRFWRPVASFDGLGEEIDFLSERVQAGEQIAVKLFIRQ